MPARITIAFETRQHDLGAATADHGLTRQQVESRRQVEALAYGLFQDMMQRGPEEPPPTITVVGYGNARLGGQATGLDRAQAVADLLMHHLTSERSRYELGGRDQSTLPRVADVRPTVIAGSDRNNPRTEGPDLSTRRRAVVIDVAPASPTVALGGPMPPGGWRPGDGGPTSVEMAIQDAPAHAPGTAQNPLPLSSLLAPGHLDLDDVVFTPLKNASGEVVGVAFPRGAKEAASLETAFQRGVGDDGAYSVAMHHSDRGFAVQRKSDGKEVRIDEAGVLRLLRGTALPGGQSWRQHSELVFLSCRVADPALGNRLNGLAGLLGDEGYNGAVRGPDTPVTLHPDGTRSFPDHGGMRTAERSGVELGDQPAVPAPALTSAYRAEPAGGPLFESVPSLLPESARTDGGFPAFGRVTEGPISHDQPKLRVSGNSTLAINGTRSVNGAHETIQAREFFATPEVLKGAQEVLRRLGSEVELVSQAAHVVVDADGAKQTLHRVVPKIFDSIDVCRDFATRVLGAEVDALLFQDQDGGAIPAKVNASHGMEVTGAYHLAGAMAEAVDGGSANRTGAQWAADAVARDERRTGGAGGPGRARPTGPR
ncbi:hypothetical protein ACOBQX_03810 [Actinokineospora sp. G85]|uniref:hypothetical protein n=1 Tax=Actinokineospora sp. G85 TaxID=3406626 RepID=UPI003C75DCF5